MSLNVYDEGLSYEEMSNDDNDENEDVLTFEEQLSDDDSSHSPPPTPPPKKSRSKRKASAKKLKVKFDKLRDLGSDDDDNDDDDGRRSPSPPPVKQRRKKHRGKKSHTDKSKVSQKKKKRGSPEKRESTHKTEEKSSRSAKTRSKKSSAGSKKGRKMSRLLDENGKQTNFLLSHETGLFIPPLSLKIPKQSKPTPKLPKLPKLEKGVAGATASSSSSSSSKPTTTSMLLSTMIQTFSAPKYTSVTTSSSPPATEYPSCPTRSCWPLLRQMISTPPVADVSISPAPRQTLSTVLVDPVTHDEPKPSVLNKLDKDIKCVCKFNHGQPCWLLFDEDRLRRERLHHLTLKRESLDLVILAKIAANINREGKLKKKNGKDRQRCRLCYFHEGRQICRETFLYIHGICKGRLCALMHHYNNQGLSVRVHGNKANVPPHALSYSDSERVLDFIRTYANDHCVSSFGRKPGSKAGGGLLIMSPTQSKLYVHYKYKQHCAKNNFRTVSLRSFQNLWTKHLPYIVVLRGSNKTPVPEPGSQEALMDLQQDYTDMDFANEVAGAVAAVGRIAMSKAITANGAGPGIHPPNVSQSHPHANTNVGHMPNVMGNHLNCNASTDEKKKRKRKTLPPRKIEAAANLPVSTMSNPDLAHAHGMDDSQLSMHSAASTGSTAHNTSHNPSGHNPAHISNDHTHGAGHGSGHHTVHNHRSSSTNSVLNNSHGIQSPISQPELHHSMYTSDLHIPSSSSSSPLHQHHAAVMSYHSRTAASPMRLAPNKSMLPYNTKAMPTMKTPNLRPALYLPQPSPLLDTYSMHCADRYAPPMPGTHGLADQSQAVLLPHQGADLSNMHQIDWQAWQPYTSL